MRRLAGTLGLLLFLGVAAVGALEAWQLAGSTYDELTFPASVAPGLAPRLRAADAYRITLHYLEQAMAESEVGTTVAPDIRSVWAVTADQAAGLDACIPAGKGSGIVWVTKGAGTYLNLAALPWSRPSQPGDDPAQLACRDPAQAGTIVIDDATGEILGVYPENPSNAAQPSPRASTSASPPSSARPSLPASILPPPSSARPSPTGS